MKINKDLGYNYSEMGPSIASMDAEQYPTTRLEGKDELDLPDAGTITFKFKRIREENSTDTDGKHRYCCTLELQELVSVESGKEAPTKKYNTAADALDKLMKAAKEAGSDTSEEGEY